MQLMMHNVERKTMRWQFIKSLEPPRTVHVRTADVLTKANLFAQVTVRLHSQQVKISFTFIVNCKCGIIRT